MMDTIEKLFLWGIPILVIYLFFRTRQGHRELNDVFKQLARETGGQFSRSGELRYPILTVEHQGRQFTLTNGLATGGKVWVTKLYTELSLNQPFHLRIQPTDVLEEFSKKLGFQDVELGHPEFDKQYLVKTVDSRQARALIDLELQKLLVRLRPLRPELWIDEKSIHVSTQMQDSILGYGKLVKLGRALCEIRPG